MIVEKVSDGKFAFRLDDGDFRDKTGYRAFLDDIKTITSQCRRYDGRTRIWTIDDKFFGFVIQRLTYHFLPPDGVPLCEAGALARLYPVKVKKVKRARSNVPLRKAVA